MLSESHAVLVEELRASHEELQAQAEELAEAHRAAVAERQRYLSLFDHAPVPYLVTDADGTITLANRATAAMLRCRGDRLARKPLASFIPIQGRQHFRQQLLRIIRSGEPGSVLLRVSPRDGADRVLTGTVAPVSDASGRVTELRWLLVPAAMGTEITRTSGRDRRELEAEVDAVRKNLRDMTELLAWLSHELRTPATSIGGYADILVLGVRGRLAPEQEAILVRIQQAQSHLVALLDDLMTFARAGSGALQVDLTDVALDSVFEQLQAMTEPLAAARNIRLSLRTPANVSVRADAERVLQILLNLAVNAVKFTPIGGTVSVGCDPEGNHVLITVRDSGPGIAPDARERIFRPYVRLGKPGEPRVHGAGLGLAISRTLAQAMDGDVSCADAADEGAVFVVRLPRSMGIAASVRDP